MVMKFLKENLPWIAPTAAIVMLATGFFDRSGSENGEGVSSAREKLGELAGAASDFLAPKNETETATATAALVPAISAPAVSAPVPAGLSAPVQTVEAPEVTRAATPSFNTSATASALDLNTVKPVAFQEPPVAEPTPKPAPLTPETVTASLSPDNASNGFLAAQENLAARNSCIDDLRALTSDARVYFPSGGLSGAAEGLVQARLIGLIAQNCPGVTIEVGGHSDPSGRASTNLKLSTQRAEAVISRIASSGVDTRRFVAKGYGDAQPSGLTGPEPRSYYDRRVEFRVIENAARPTFGATSASLAGSACVSKLADSVKNTRIFYSSGSVAVSPSDLNAAYQLAAQATACPEARLRVIGHHSDTVGSAESLVTARLRAVVLMSTLVGAGFEPEQIIIAAPSRTKDVPGQPGLSKSRIDFDFILEDS